MKKEQPDFIPFARQWLKERHADFPCPPYLWRASGKFPYFQFKGFDQRLYARILHNTGEDSILVYAHHRGEYWDGLIEFYATPVQDASGLWYSQSCMREGRVYYSSRDEMWRDHVLETFLHWAQENITKQARLNCVSYGRGTRNAEISLII